MEQQIAAIQRYVTRKYRDTGQVAATAFWMDEKGVYGSTSGDPDSPRMVALKNRAEREGAMVADERWGVEACNRCEEPLGEAFFVEAGTGQRYHAWHEDY